VTTKNVHVMFLELLVYVVPDQSGPDHSSTRSCVVGHLGELSGVYLDSLCRREPRVRSMATALHLKHRKAYISAQDRNEVVIIYCEWSLHGGDHFELATRRGLTKATKDVG
jgi:hypothetical protein